MAIYDYFGLTPPEIGSSLQMYWIVPAGMIALYFYGMFHFNSPDYSLALSTPGETATSPAGVA
jgi:hypothetical protein